MADIKNYEIQGVKNSGKSSNTNQLTMSLAGGVLGAAIGYLVTSGNGKMLTEGIDMEKLSSKGSELSDAVMDKSRNLLQTVVGTATKLFEKQEGQSKEGSLGHANGNLDNLVGSIEEMLSKLVPDGTGQMLGDKKEQLQDRMGNIVQMLSKMLDENTDQNQNRDQGNMDSKKSEPQQQDQSQLNPGEEGKANIPSGSGEEDKKKTSTGESQEKANQDSPFGKQAGQNSNSQSNSQNNQAGQTSNLQSQSVTGNKGYSILNVDEDTHNLLDGLEKDI